MMRKAPSDLIIYVYKGYKCTNDIENGSLPLTTLHSDKTDLSVCVLLFWLILSCRPALLLRAYVTDWHPASTPLWPVTLRLNTCFSSADPVAQPSLWSQALRASFKLQLFPFLSPCGVKAARTWDFSTSRPKLERVLHLFDGHTGNPIFISSPWLFTR